MLREQQVLAIKLSVIIPTRDRAALLERTLQSILAQTLSQHDFEVIVVDNGSGDNTFEVVASFQTRFEKIRYFLEPRPGLHAGRHRGLAEAASNLLVFADDDVEAFPTWLEAIADAFADPRAVLVGGKCLPRYAHQPPSWLDSLWEENAHGRVNGWLSLIDLGESRKEIPAHLVYGCNFAIRREVLAACGGFHPDSMPWELRHLRGDGETHVSEFVRDHKLLAVYDPAASVYHNVSTERLTKAYFCRRAFLQAISYSYAATRSGTGTVPVVVKVVLRIFQVLLREIVLSRKKLKRHWLYLVCGLVWHQTLVLARPDLREWIAKEDYFE